MIKLIMISLAVVSMISCNNKNHSEQKFTANVKKTESVSNMSVDNTFEDETIIPSKDSINLEKVEKKLTQTKWYKDVMRNSKKVSTMILPPIKSDSLHYWFKVGDNRPDRFVTFRQYATKRGEWKLLYYDTESGKLVPVKE